MFPGCELFSAASAASLPTILFQRFDRPLYGTNQLRISKGTSQEEQQREHQYVHIHAVDSESAAGTEQTRVCKHALLK